MSKILLQIFALYRTTLTTHAVCLCMFSMYLY